MIKQTAIISVCLLGSLALITGTGILIKNLMSRSSDTKKQEQDVVISEQPVERMSRTGVAMLTASASMAESFSDIRLRIPEVEKETSTGLSEEEIQQKAKEFLDNMTLEEKVAQMFIITPEALTGHDGVNRAGDATKKALEEYPVGGLVYFSKNLVHEDQLKKMTGQVQKYAMEISGLPLLLSIDEEGGTVARIANHWGFRVEKVGDMSKIGESGDLKRAYEAGDTIGSYLHSYGLNMDFAPVADVLSNPDNDLLKKRSFGSDSKLVSEMAVQVAKALEGHDVYAVMKHFPGHGAVAGDTHDGMAYTEKTLDQLQKNEFVPFKEAIEQGIDFIMVAHISVPQVIGTNTPSSLSRTMVTDILRGQLGYDGIVITDALDMGAIKKNYSSGQAAVMAVQAGVDILLMPEDFKTAYQAVIDAVKDGIISEERIDESVMRIVIRKLSVGYSWNDNGTLEGNESRNSSQDSNRDETQSSVEPESGSEQQNREFQSGGESQAGHASASGNAPESSVPESSSAAESKNTPESSSAAESKNTPESGSAAESNHVLESSSASQSNHVTESSNASQSSIGPGIGES